MRQPRAVLFDFDFTLGDSSKGIFDCLRHACACCGIQNPTEADMRAMIGLPLPVIHGRIAGDATTEPDFVAAFHRRADVVMEAATTMFPEAVAAVQRVRTAGVRTGIVSTKYRWRIESILSGRGLSDSFDVIVGLEDVAAPKPDPAGLLAAAARLSLDPGEVLYVGDHEVDARAAAGAGMPFLGVLTGATTPEAFCSYGVGCVASLAELPGRLGLDE